ncbi:DUF1127 domain-containing protein [Martelella endophytica]|nr:DUF1127 domain-containing protein [Martelella endophytica]
MTEIDSTASPMLLCTLRRASARLMRTVFVHWPQRRRQRLVLLQLSDDHLRDIGVTPDEARQEAGRPFWD